MAHPRYLQYCARALHNISAFCDVTLVCEDEVIHAHKLIILAYSRLLGSQILGVMSPDQVTMNLDNLELSGAMVKNIIFFMYHGYFNDLDDTNVVELHRTANVLQVREAAYYLEDFVRTSNKCMGMRLIGYPQTQELKSENIEAPVGKEIFSLIFENEECNRPRSTDSQTQTDETNIKSQALKTLEESAPERIKENDFQMPDMDNITFKHESSDEEMPQATASEEFNIQNESAGPELVTNLIKKDLVLRLPKVPSLSSPTKVVDEDVDEDDVNDFPVESDIDDDDLDPSFTVAVTKPKSVKIKIKKSMLKSHKSRKRARKNNAPQKCNVKKRKSSSSNELSRLDSVEVKKEDDDTIENSSFGANIDDFVEQTSLNEDEQDEKKEKSPKRKNSSRIFSECRQGGGTYKCPDCGTLIKGYREFFEHLKTHRGDRVYHCNACPKTFTCSKHLKSHLRTHSSERPYLCEVCGASFKDPKHRNRHRKLHSGEKPIKCTFEGCDQRFVDRDRMRKHVDVCHLHYKPHKCDHPGCDYASSSKNAVDIHKIKHLPKESRQAILCDICGKPLTGARSIKLHMLIHEGEEIKCKMCDYSSVFKGAVKSHMLRLHGVDLDGNKVDKQYKCHICGFEAYFTTEFKFHMAKHTGERPHKCPICNFDTNDKGTLKKHMRGHTGETPFPCKFCGKAYSNQSALARHKRTHTGEKPYKCDQCDMAYADKKSLVAHSYKHIGIKPFMCHICTYTCVKKPNLASHIRKVHGDAALPEDMRPKAENKKHRPRMYRDRSEDRQMESFFNQDEDEEGLDQPMYEAAVAQVRQDTIQFAPASYKDATSLTGSTLNRQDIVDTLVSVSPSSQLAQFVRTETDAQYVQIQQLQQQSHQPGIATVSDIIPVNQTAEPETGLDLSIPDASSYGSLSQTHQTLMPVRMYQH